MKTRSLLLLSLLSPFAALITGCGDSNSAAAPQFTQMTFLSNRTVSPPTEMFTQKLDGTGVTPVPLTNQNPYYVSISADAKKVAFYQNGDAWVMNADGSGALQLTTDQEDEFARISPDETKILVSDGSPEHVSIMNVDGTGKLDLTPTLPASMTNCYAPAFSADSALVVFVCEGSTNYGIYTVKPDGTGTATVTNTLTTWTDLPSLSPDNKKVYFISESSGEGQPETFSSMNLDGSGETVILPNTYEAIILGSNIYYTFYSTALQLNQVYKAGLDGSGAVSLSDGLHSDYLGIAE